MNRYTKKRLVLLAAAALLLGRGVDLGAQALLPGYSFRTEAAPTGQEWQSPEDYARNKQLPHSYFFSFAAGDRAERVLPEHSSLYRSLDGRWRFHWVRTPEERPQDFYRLGYDASRWDEVNVPMSWNVYGLQKDGTQRYGTPIYVNQPVIFYHEVKVGDWKKGVMRTPPKDWTTYRDRNEVGSYLRHFSVPSDWAGKAVYINFDGVDSFFYLWIDGRYVGFSKNSRNLASFDISPYLDPKLKEHTVAVEVYRSSDGSFLEAQDMFRLPGIFRSVYLTAKPQTQLRDLRVLPGLTKDYQTGTLSIAAEVSSLSKKAKPGQQLRYSLYGLPLYSDEAEARPVATATAKVSAFGTTEAQLTLSEPRVWSAEAPWRYVLVAELYDAGGKTLLDKASLYTGFRTVEIKDTPASEDEFGIAGRYYYVNGKPVKLKGTNRHETNPALGHAITKEQMEREVMMMKRANINHVRNSHYPPSPYWYYLCDKYGIYLEDEANIESHEYYYGAASLSHVPEWETQHVARMLEMVHANYNHPSIVIWSLGNEAGPGVNFVKSYQATKKLDTSRPIQYERNNEIVDMGSNQYPSVSWVQGAAKGGYKIKYPFHISEYAHSMGNACGGLSDMWPAIESTNFICGGAIWDWVDQALYNYKPDGTRYLAYGGDFGDKPNSGMFVMNGLVFADLEPKPQYYEVKKVYQNVGFAWADRAAHRLRISNKNYFTDLSDYELRWRLIEDGVVTRSGTQQLPAIGARQSAELSLDPSQLGQASPEKEYFLTLELVLKVDKPWAKAGYVQADEQLLYQSKRPEVAQPSSGLRLTKVTKEGDSYSVTGRDFSAAFDLKEGTLSSLVYAGDTLLRPGQGPHLNAFRAPADNDIWARRRWVANGLHNLRHQVQQYKVQRLADGSLQLFFTVRSQAPNAAVLKMERASGRYEIIEDTTQRFGPEDFHFTSQVVWTVRPDGTIQLNSGISSNKPNLVLARLGYEFILPKSYDQYRYYGRGPINNYGDRKSGQFVQLHQSTVAGQFISFPKPQTMANREDVRWTSLTNAAGNGLLFISDSLMTSSALPYSALDLLLAPHPTELPPAGDTHLVLGISSTGLGGFSCGQGPPTEQYQTKAEPHYFGLTIRPLRGIKPQQTHSTTVPQAAAAPIIARGLDGMLSLKARPGAELMIQIGKAKAQRYTGPVLMREPVQVKAWDRRHPELVSVEHFTRVETVQATILSASSEEVPYGDEAANLLDFDPGTIWHSMYSVTVTKYPHWIDFDVLDTKLIRAFTYLPRQDENWTGDIKDYAISISQDGKTWTEVQKGTFAKDKKLKRVDLSQPQRARYLRFTALSAQNGGDYASGAEMSIIAD